MTNIKTFSVLFFCSLFFQNVTMGMKTEEESIFTLEDQYGTTHRSPHTQFNPDDRNRTNSVVSELEPTPYPDEPFFIIDGLNENNQSFTGQKIINLEEKNPSPSSNLSTNELVNKIENRRCEKHSQSLYDFASGIAAIRKRSLQNSK